MSHLKTAFAVDSELFKFLEFFVCTVQTHVWNTGFEYLRRDP